MECRRKEECISFNLICKVPHILKYLREKLDLSIGNSKMLY